MCARDSGVTLSPFATRATTSMRGLRSPGEARALRGVEIVEALAIELGRVVGGKYRIDRLVAAGSMGEVYEAVHIGIGRRVALKRMSPRVADHAESAARFRREARAAGALDSEYIVQLFDAGADADFGAYLVTELLAGEDLEARLAREGILDATVVATMGYQVARGLAKAHAAGVVHRDLKPGNVFLAAREDGGWIAKILDFGISKTTLHGDWSQDDASLTGAGMTLGTPHYMSPEQVCGDPDIDGRSDVWSLCATMFEAIAGAPPFDAESPIEVLLGIVQRDAPPLARAAPWAPRTLCDVVQAGLAHDRDARTPDAATLARGIVEAMPEMAPSRSGKYLASSRARDEGEGPATIPAPPPEHGDPAPSSPSSTGDRVEVFRREGGRVVPVPRAT